MFDSIEIVVQPLEEPVFLADAIKHVRGIQEGDDALLQQMLIAARQRGEAFTRRSFCTQTLDVWYSDPSGVGYFDLPRGPVQEIVNLWTYGYDSVETPAEDILNYHLAGSSLLYGLYDWPTAYRSRQGIKIRLVCGYGDPEDVPDAIKMGILQYAAHLYENRLGEGPEARFVAMAQRGILPALVQDLWRPYQIVLV